MCRKAVDIRVRQADKLLVGWRIHMKFIPFLDKTLFQFLCQTDSMFPHLQIKSVSKQRFKLNTQQASLGEQCSVLFNQREKCGRRSACGATTASPNNAPTFVPPI